MRKLLAVMLCISLLLLSAGCGGMKPVWVRDAVISFDRKTETLAAGVPNGLLAEGKKYDYKSGNVVIMRITNQTNTTMDLMIHMAYQNEEGHTILEEDREFLGFLAGWQNYFVFHPIIAFADYTYTLTARPNDGISYVNNITFEHRGDKFGVMRLSPCYFDAGMEMTDLSAYVVSANSCSKKLYWGADFVWFDNRGELYMIDDLLQWTTTDPYSTHAVQRPVLEKLPYSWDNRNLYQPPEELTGELTGLIALKRVDTEGWPYE